MSTIRATITTAAIATMATVDAARITAPSFPAACLRKPRRERGLEQIGRQLQSDARGGSARPWPTRLADARVRGQLFEPVAAPCVTAEEAKNRAEAIAHARASATRLIRRVDVHVTRIRSHSTTRSSRGALPSHAAFAASRRRSRRRSTFAASRFAYASGFSRFSLASRHRLEPHDTRARPSTSSPHSEQNRTGGGPRLAAALVRIPLPVPSVELTRPPSIASPTQGAELRARSLVFSPALDNRRSHAWRPRTPLPRQRSCGVRPPPW
jgi:hypothetical protein